MCKTESSRSVVNEGLKQEKAIVALEIYICELCRCHLRRYLRSQDHQIMHAVTSGKSDAESVW